MAERTYWATVKQYCHFNKEEKKALIIQILLFAFIFSYDDWGETSFNFIIGMKNFFLALIVVTIGVLIHEVGHRLYAIKYGFKVETKLWWYGILIGLILCIISGGKLLFFAAHGVFIHQMSVHRLGHFRYGPNIVAFCMVALSGPLLNIFFASLLKTIDVWFSVGLTTIPFLNDLFLFSWRT